MYSSLASRRPDGCRHAVADTRPLKAVRLIYRARIAGGELTNEIGGSTDEARWFSLTDVPRLRRVALVDVAIAMWGAVAGSDGPDLDSA